MRKVEGLKDAFGIAGVGLNEEMPNKHARNESVRAFTGRCGRQGALQNSGKRASPVGVRSKRKSWEGSTIMNNEAHLKTVKNIL